MSFAMGTTKDMQEKKGFYSYNRKDASRFLQRLGYSDLSKDFKIYWDTTITRNSDGSAIRFLDWGKRKGVVVSCDGSIKEINIPGYRALFNDQHQAVAWLDNGRVFYKNGMNAGPPLLIPGADPGGRYFVRPASSGGTEIYSIERPKTPLAKASAYCSGRINVRHKDNKVYLFGIDCNLPVGKRKYIKAYVFENIGNKLIKKEEISIPSPKNDPNPLYAVIDLSPWSDEVAVIDVYDWPSRSKLYLFNLKTREMRKIGTASRWGFYLQCDIIKKVTEKLKSRVKP